MAVNERRWQGWVLVWINTLLQDTPALPFKRAEQEFEVEVEGRKRRFNDLTLFDQKGKPACVIELKMPDRADGHGASPRHPRVVTETQRKADAIGSEYFLTWNGYSAVLWKTFIEHRPVMERSLQAYPTIARVLSSSDLEVPQVQEQQKKFIQEWLFSFAQIYTGQVAIVAQPVDEAFAQTLQSYLDPALVGTITYALGQRYRSDRAFAQALTKWAVEDQGWTWEASPEGLERTARLACLMLINKVVFYEALRKPYPSFLSLSVPTDINTDEQLKAYFEAHFKRVVDNKDYETVFTSEGVMDEVPFFAENAVPMWASLVEAVEKYDFAALPYEIIGSVFQRLIAPDERHKLGQYFTRSDLVDLINAFCIRAPDAAVLDPGCGAGTFLVRAYAELKALAQLEGVTWIHKDVLGNLWGVDIARYPAHLSTINLAVRELSSEDNYPRILHKDFFQVSPRKPAQLVQRAYGVLGPGVEKVEAPLPAFDAVVGNPPYIRQEEMEELHAGLKEQGHNAVWEDWKIRVSRRSSIYALFLLHGAAFLKEGGYLGMVTHSSWLDVDYGKHLQEFFLNHFQIVAVIESEVEHWFPDADINTAITVVRRCGDKTARDSHKVKFVQLKVPLRDIIPGGDEVVRIQAIRALVRRVEATENLTEDEFGRIYTVSQAELWREGLDEQGEYAGAKCGKYLRAPEVFFKVMERAEDKLRRLGDIAQVRRGFTTGANEFFYVKDVTDALPDAELSSEFRLTRRQAKRVRVVETEEGERHLIEAEFLRPLIKSTRDVESLLVESYWVKSHALMATKDKRELRGTHVLKYIQLGETKVFGRGPRGGVPAHKPTCASRKPWYGLDESNKGRFLWFALITDTHAVAYNPNDFLSDKRFYNIHSKDLGQEKLLWGLLNSTFTFLCAELWGRQFAGRGIDSIDITVYEVAQLPMLAPDSIEPEVAQRIEHAVEGIARRPVLPVLEEVHQPDRQALDEAVLEAMGFADAEERAGVLAELYEAACEKVKKRFERARSGHPTQSRSRPTAEALARELAGEFSPALIKSFPRDFILGGIPTRESPIPDETGDMEWLTQTRLRFGEETRDYPAPQEADFVYLAVRAGAKGSLMMPMNQALLRGAIEKYRGYLVDVERELNRLSSSRTRNRKLKEAIKEQLRRRLGLPPVEPTQVRLV